jgi:hypothetical protein
MIAFKGIHSQDKSQGIIEIPSAFDLYVKDQVESGMVTYSEYALGSVKKSGVGRGLCHMENFVTC